jgi:hypothetical protein
LPLARQCASGTHQAPDLALPQTNPDPRAPDDARPAARSRHSPSGEAPALASGAKSWRGQLDSRGGFPPAARNLQEGAGVVALLCPTLRRLGYRYGLCNWRRNGSGCPRRRSRQSIGRARPGHAAGDLPAAVQQGKVRQTLAVRRVRRQRGWNCENSAGPANRRDVPDARHWRRALATHVLVSCRAERRVRVALRSASRLYARMRLPTTATREVLDGQGRDRCSERGHRHPVL